MLLSIIGKEVMYMYEKVGFLATVGLPIIGAGLFHDVFIGLATFTLLATAIAFKRIIPKKLHH